MDKQVGKAWEEIQQVLRQETALCWIVRMSPTMVGVHNKNRGGTGFSLSIAITNGAKHCKSGYNIQKAGEGAWAVQCDGLPSAIAFNEHLSKVHALPQLTQCMIVSFGSTHSNVFLRYAMSVDDDDLQNNKALQEACQRGIEWKVIHSLVDKRMPRIVTIGCKALNARTHRSDRVGGASGDLPGVRCHHGHGSRSRPISDLGCSVG